MGLYKKGGKMQVIPLVSIGSVRKTIAQIGEERRVIRLGPGKGY
jgi:hypothetical protein